MKRFIQDPLTQKIVFLSLATFCLSPFATSPLALVLGFLSALLLCNPFQQHAQRYIHLLLQVSIVGLGFGLNLNEALEAGRKGFGLTIASIVTVLVLGYLLGRTLKLDKKLSYLLSVGTAICGGSAIAAVSPILKPDNKHISLALAIVFTLNSVALFLYPAIGHWLQLSQQQFGLWCAIGIHDTSSVVGAANKYGSEALRVATIVKLARALWIIPVSVMTLLLFKSGPAKIQIPWFIVYFVIAILLHTYFPIPDNISDYLTHLAKAGLNLTLFLIGSTLSAQTLRTIGSKPLLLAVALWLTISVSSLLYIIS